MVGIFEEKKKMQEETQNSLMTTAACLYIELEDNIDLKNTCLKNGCTINTNTLINAGLLNEEDVPKNKNITIKKENNVKTCTIAN